MSEKDINRWHEAVLPKHKSPEPWVIGRSWDTYEVQPIPDSMLAELAQLYSYCGTPWNCHSLPLSPSDREFMYLLYYSMHGLIARFRAAEQRATALAAELARFEAADAQSTLQACATSAPAAPDALLTDEQWHLIYFDDADRKPEIFNDKQSAYRRYKQISASWNAHLFVRVHSNSRDFYEREANRTAPGHGGQEFTTALSHESHAAGHASEAVRDVAGLLKVAVKFSDIVGFDLFLGGTFLGNFDPGTVTPLANALTIATEKAADALERMARELDVTQNKFIVADSLRVTMATRAELAERQLVTARAEALEDAAKFCGDKGRNLNLTATRSTKEARGAPTLLADRCEKEARIWLRAEEEIRRLQPPADPKGEES